MSDATPDEALAEIPSTDRSMVLGSEAMPNAVRASSADSDHDPTVTSLRALLARYDVQVSDALETARAASSGLERVRAIHNSVRPALVVHDAVLESVLCPVLEHLPEGLIIGERLRSGVRERADLLSRFEAVSRHVAAHNVYPVSGAEVEQVLEGLERSFTAHLRDEVTRASDILVATTDPTDVDAIAAALAMHARHARSRRPWSSLRSKSPVFLAIGRWKDRLDDWSDTHWNWSVDAARLPRRELANALRRQAGMPTPSVRSILGSYDAAVDTIIGELRSATTPEDRAIAAHRIAAAMAIHDSVVGGVLCPLLEAVPGGAEVASRLRAGCHERALLQQRWDTLTREVPTADVFRIRRPEADAIMEALLEHFRTHEREETFEVGSLLTALPDSAFRTASSALDDVMWPWHSEGPALLALRMAMWDEKAPARTHPVLLRRPTSRILRQIFRVVDEFRDHLDGTWIERWFFPHLPRRPYPW